MEEIREFPAYTYYLYHVPTGKKYYGVRWANKCDPEHDLWNEYFGSSVKVNDLLASFGKESFISEVRKIFETAEEAIEWEDKVLHRLKAPEREDWLNQAYSCGPFYNVGPMAESSKIKMRIAAKKRIRYPHKEETKEKIRIAHLGLPGTMTGKKHKDSSKLLMSEKSKGRVISEDKRKTMNQDKRGVPLKDDHREKIRISLLGNTRKLGKRHTKEFKEQKRLQMMGNTFRRGIPHREDTKIKMRESAKHRPIQSEETRRKRSASMKKTMDLKKSRRLAGLG
jgi:hypothetical protein